MKEFLILSFFITSAGKGYNPDEQAALRNSSRAFYKQSGLEKEINTAIKKEIPKNLQIVAGNTFLILKTIEDQRLTITWSF